MASPTPAPDRPDPDSIAQRLKKQFGDQIDPTLPLDPEPAPDTDAPSSLFDKLRGAGTRGTRYRLLGEVARGGMGVILKIWDDELRRTLAMKVVLGRGDEATGETPVVDPKTLGRFLEEAQVTGQLDHPGIVPVHELGLGADGRVYFTMRLVKGEDLRTIFEKVRTGEDGWNQVRALGVLFKVCEAMSYAHSKKVVHRDLKPANVMVGKFGEVYVMDWGLARVLGRDDKHDLRIQPQPTTQSVVKTERREKREETPDSPLVTMDGDIVGTPSFMPPEQAKGQLDKLGPHSDVYSLGAMLYQLITGELPYIPKGAVVSQRTILEAVLRHPPEPIESLAPRTSPELVAICEKAMDREISRRYRDMGELAADLRSFVENGVVGAYQSSLGRRLRSYWKRLAAPTRVGLVLGYVVLPLFIAVYWTAMTLGHGSWTNLSFFAGLYSMLALSAGSCVLLAAGLFFPKRPKALGACALIPIALATLILLPDAMLIQPSPKTPEWRIVADAAMKAGRYPEVVAAMRAAPTEDRRVEDQVEIARSLKAAGQLALALEAMDVAWGEVSRDSWDGSWHALLLLEMNQPERARQVLSNALKDKTPAN